MDGLLGRAAAAAHLEDLDAVLLVRPQPQHAGLKSLARVEGRKCALRRRDERAQVGTNGERQRAERVVHEAHDVRLLYGRACVDAAGRERGLQRRDREALQLLKRRHMQAARLPCASNNTTGHSERPGRQQQGKREPHAFVVKSALSRRADHSIFGIGQSVNA